MASHLWGNFGSTKKQASKKTGKNLVETLRQMGEIPDEIKGVEEKTKSLEKRQREQIFHLKRVQQESQEIWNRHEREARIEIETLREEVKSLAQQTEGISKNLDIAAEQPIINPGEADISFLRSLKEAIKGFRKRIEDASIWLSILNQKSKKQGFWGIFTSKKGGAGFLLSSEHYVSRSAG